MRLEFSRRYSMAHRLIAGGASKCVTPHGHDEVVKITLRATGPLAYGASNMSAAFEHAKGRWNRWIDGVVDHAFHVNAADPMVEFFRDREPETLARLMVFDGDPTTEALAIAFFAKLSAFLAEDGLFQPVAIAIQETPSNTVLLTAEEFAAIDWVPGAWCKRSDDSINDFDR
jgi:6-pyruvoyltetrahydropterin/6-carboxytetrahydropterin synthase